MLRKITILVGLLAEAAGCVALLGWSVQTFGAERVLAACDAMALGMITSFAVWLVILGVWLAAHHSTARRSGSQNRRRTPR